MWNPCEIAPKKFVHRINRSRVQLEMSPRLTLTTEPAHFDFNVAIPARYEIVSRSGDIRRDLDGAPYHGARFLAAGRYTLESASVPEDLAVLWAHAIDQHFTPFARLAAQ
jgi:hypothetical protein